MAKIDMRIALPTIDNNTNGLGDQPDTQTMAQLRDAIEIKQKAGISTRADEVAYYFKTSLPFLCLTFALCAPPLSMSLSKSGAFAGVFLSILMIFVAWNTMILAKALGINGYIPPIAAAWATDIIFAALGLVLLRRIE
jgi:lipopolysaccharide export LptBFGC system permease protein LptF